MGNPNPIPLLAIQWLNGSHSFSQDCSGQKQKEVLWYIYWRQKKKQDIIQINSEVFLSSILEILYGTFYSELRDRPIKTSTMIN